MPKVTDEKTLRDSETGIAVKRGNGEPPYYIIHKRTGMRFTEYEAEIVLEYLAELLDKSPTAINDPDVDCPDCGQVVKGKFHPAFEKATKSHKARRDDD